MNAQQKLLLWSLLVLLSFGAPAVGQSESETPNKSKKANFLIIVSDDQRPDTIGALGNRFIKTPNLDSLVRQGTTFTRAICPFPLCVPSRAEILTGVSAFGNGVPYGGGRLKVDSIFWASTMKQAGYRAAYCGKWMNDGSPKTRGYDETYGLFSNGGAGTKGREPIHGRKGRLVTGYRGWTFKKNDGSVELNKGIGLTAKTSRHIADGAIAFLDQLPPEPFFLHVNFTAPHDPLVVSPENEDRYDSAKMPLPKNFRDRHPFDHGNFNGRDEKLLPWPRTEQDVRDEIAAYYSVLDDMDAQIGRILEKLDDVGATESTFVVFTSDHGLALGSHGLMGKQNMYEHTIGVPFIIKGPGVSAGRKTPAQIYLRDLFPTNCELAGIEIPESVDGISFASILRGDVEHTRDAVYGYFQDSQRMIRTDRWKLIHYPKIGRLQLFDVVDDPHELDDLACDPAQLGRVKDLADRMNKWFHAHGDKTPPVDLSDKQ